MFDWMKSVVRRWLLDDNGPDGAPVTKAPRGATLTGAFVGSPLGSHSPVWNEYQTRQHNREWVYAAVRATAQRIAGQPIKIGTKKTSSRSAPGSAKAGVSANPAASGSQVRELPEHELNDLFDSPNPYLTESGLLASVVSALEISGEAYLWYDEQSDGIPLLWFLPTGWVREDPEAGEPLSRFIVRPEQSTEEFNLSRTEIIRIHYPDPANPFRALSPLQAAARSVLADEEILASQLATFANGGRPGLLVKIGREAAESGIGDADDSPALTRAQRETLRQRIKEATSGSQNTGEPIILDAVIKEVSKITNTPAEMDFGQSALLTRDRILAVFGVPKVVLGMTDDANRASAVVSDETFCFHKCAPICRLVSDHLTAFFRVIYDDPNLVVWIDPPRPRDPDGMRADTQQLIGAGAITIDELRERHGLPPLPDGAGKAPVRAGSAGNTVSAPVPADLPERDDKPGSKNEPGVKRLWDYMTQAQKLEVFKDSKSGVRIRL